MEIERKFLVDLSDLPFDPKDYPARKIEQAYLCTAPVVRIRRDNDDFFLTYKSKGMMVREEYNLPLTKESYYHLLLKADGRIITKTRYVIPIENGLFVELKATLPLSFSLRSNFPMKRLPKLIRLLHGSKKT